jgi:integration host factor subunit beta
MTKADLIEEVSRLAELTRKDSEIIVETIFDSIVRSLRTGDKIEIRGFGSFRTRQRKPRVGRNPKTGDRVDVPAKKIPFFKPSKEFPPDFSNSPRLKARLAPFLLLGISGLRPDSDCRQHSSGLSNLCSMGKQQVCPARRA